MEEIATRNLRAGDEPFIYDSWLKSYYDDCIEDGFVRKKLFYKRHQPVVTKLIEKSIIRLAVESEDPDVIIGYIVYEEEPKTVHYCYVKGSFRRFGICKRLLYETNCFEGTYVTHLTRKAKPLQLKMGFIYSPYFD